MKFRSVLDLSQAWLSKLGVEIGGGGEGGNQQEEEAKVFQTRPDILHSQPITSEFGESDIEQGGGGDEIE